VCTCVCGADDARDARARVCAPPQLDTYEEQVAREGVHQELFTRLLERLDGLVLDGLSDEERALVRAQRKELVRRTQLVSGQC
jgi:hypothetical protein